MIKRRWRVVRLVFPKSVGLYQVPELFLEQVVDLDCGW